MPFIPSKPSNEVIDTPDKEMAFVAAGQSLPLRDDDPAYPALYLFNYMAGGGPSSHIFTRLRQKEGISYGAFSQILAHPIDRTRTFEYWKDLNGKIEKLTRAQIDTAAKQFIAPDKLAKVRAGDLSKQKK